MEIFCTFLSILLYTKKLSLTKKEILIINQDQRYLKPCRKKKNSQARRKYLKTPYKIKDMDPEK